ncbi:MAG: hypothetical protein ACTSUD_01745 [Alphaproteobacteria bacterium]
MVAEDITVAFDSDEVRVTRPGGAVESVRWDQLQTVLIATTDEGPFADDFLWLLIGDPISNGCVIPMGAEGLEALVDRLVELPGFDHQALIDASSSTENNRFLCWQRPG